MTDPTSITRCLRGLDEPTTPPRGHTTSTSALRSRSQTRTPGSGLCRPYYPVLKRSSLLPPRRITVFLALLATTFAGGCSSNDVVPAAPNANGVDDGDGSTTETDCGRAGPRYHVFLASGSCGNVEGNGGRWLGRTAFPKAPAEIRDSACTYQWVPKAGEDPTAADVDALAALEPELLTKSVDTLAPCEVVAPTTLALAALPEPPEGSPEPTGVTGCDVCGRVFDRDVFVILPEAQLDLRTLVVTTTTGRYLSFDVERPPRGAQVFSARLPPLVANAKYTAGRLIFLEPPKSP